MVSAVVDQMRIDLLSLFVHAFHTHFHHRKYKDANLLNPEDDFEEGGGGGMAGVTVSPANSAGHKQRTHMNNVEDEENNSYTRPSTMRCVRVLQR